jgi:hypothetical protein
MPAEEYLAREHPGAGDARSDRAARGGRRAVIEREAWRSWAAWLAATGSAIVALILL